MVTNNMREWTKVEKENKKLYKKAIKQVERIIVDVDSMIRSLDEVYENLELVENDKMNHGDSIMAHLEESVEGGLHAMLDRLEERSK